MWSMEWNPSTARPSKGLPELQQARNVAAAMKVGTPATYGYLRHSSRLQRRLKFKTPCFDQEHADGKLTEYFLQQRSRAMAECCSPLEHVGAVRCANRLPVHVMLSVGAAACLCILVRRGALQAGVIAWSH